MEVRTPSEGRVSQFNTASRWFEFTDRRAFHLFVEKKTELIVRPKQMAKDKVFIMFVRGVPTEVDYVSLIVYHVPSTA